MDGLKIKDIKNAIKNNQKISGKLFGTSIIFSFKDMDIPYLGLAIHSGTKLPLDIQKKALVPIQRMLDISSK